MEKTGRRGFACNGADSIEQIWLAGGASYGDGCRGSVLDQSQVNLLADGRARCHVVGSWATRWITRYRSASTRPATWEAFAQIFV